MGHPDDYSIACVQTGDGMSAEILLLTSAAPGASLDQVRSGIESLGRVVAMAPSQFDPTIHTADRDLVIVDATYVRQTDQLVTRICDNSPHSRVVVITASPTWQRARSAFEAGAMDYLSKNLPPQEFREALLHVLNRHRR
jgi:DNA-binding NtrC family response regulator